MKSKLLTAVVTTLAMTGAPMAQASLFNYSVQETFIEPAYGGLHDTVFNGTFTYDSLAKTITSLTGTLSEAMTWAKNPGGAQTLLNLSYNPVASSIDANGGITAYAFLLPQTNIYSDGAYGTTASTKLSNVANAYVSIYLTASELSGSIGQQMALASANFGHLFYGDCQPGGMMGPTCMTGWGAAGSWGGTSGSMGGYPTSELVTQLSAVSSVPLPPAVWSFLTGTMGLLFFGKQRKKSTASVNV